MSETDLTTCSLAYLREEFARARYFRNPVGVHYRLRLDKEIARRTASNRWPCRLHRR